MAATRPIAVANSASAMPGATTDSDVFCDAAIDWKLVMMPATVPNSPMKGPAEPTVASTKSRRSMCSISRAMATSITFSIRICKPAKDFACPSRLRFHSRLAGPNRLLKLLAGLANARKQKGLVDGDRPHPDRANKQPEHHRLHDPVGV